MLPVILQEYLREKSVRRRRVPISGVEVRNIDPVMEMVVGQHVPRAPIIMDMGVDRVRPANSRIRRILIAHVATLILVEVTGLWHGGGHGHRGGHRRDDRPRGITLPCCVPKYKRNGQIQIL